jgi:hypothetical protein
MRQPLASDAGPTLVSTPVAPSIGTSKSITAGLAAPGRIEEA